MSGTRVFTTTPKIVMGEGCLSRITDEIKRLGCRKAFIVTDSGLVDAGVAGRLEEILKSGAINFQRYDQVEPDPSLETAVNAAEALDKSAADIVIGIGGGSPIDIAKIAAALVSNPGKLSDFIGIDLIPKQGLKTIIVPTTAGTGSEVTPIVILSDETEKLKKGVVSPYLIPSIAILDPALTIGLAPQITSATGMDALIHAVEAFTSKNAYWLTDLLAREAIRLIVGNIRTAFANGSDMKARASMLKGSLLAGMAFANAGVTAVHAFAYPIGAEFHIPHGVANSIMLAPVMEFNMLGNIERFAELAQLFGEKTKGKNQRELALASVEAVRTLCTDLQVPGSLSRFGIKQTDIPMLAEGVMKVTRLLANNPRVLTLEDAQRIYNSVLQ